MNRLVRCLALALAAVGAAAGPASAHSSWSVQIYGGTPYPYDGYSYSPDDSYDYSPEYDYSYSPYETYSYSPSYSFYGGSYDNGGRSSWQGHENWENRRYDNDDDEGRDGD